MDAYQALVINNWLNRPFASMEYADQALAFAAEQNNPRFTSIAKRLKGGVYLYLGNFDSSLSCNLAATQIAIELKDSTLISNGYNNIGFTYYHFGSFPTALEYLLRSIELKRKLKLVYGLGQTLNNIGLVYTQLKDYTRARQYLTEAVSEMQRIGDKNLTLYSFNNLGFTYLDEGRLQEALPYFNRALSLADEVDNMNWHASALSGKAQILKQLGSADSALILFTHSLKLRNRIEDKKGISEIYYFLAEMKVNVSQFDSALHFVRLSQRYATEARVRQRKIANYRLASTIFEKQKRFDSAFHYQTRYISLRDSLFNENMVREISKLQQTLREEESKKELAKKDEELKRKTTITNYLIVTFLIAVLFSLALYRSYKLQKQLSKNLRTSNKDLSLKSQEIQQQKESLQLSNNELKEARERIHVQNLQLEELNRHLQNTVDLRTRELDAASRELRIVSLELDNFIYKSSHDIKGPLVRLLGICHVALLDIQEAKSREYFEMLYESARHLNDIFDRLKAVSDINASGLAREPINFQSLLEKVKYDLKDMEGFQSIEMFSNIDTSIVYESDPFLLETIFKNMLENAIRFQRKSDSHKKFIATRIEAKSQNIVISFVDNGIGINENAIEDIFKMFSKAALEHHNVGLGLYMVRQCVNKLEGIIRLVKNKEGYTEFQITLPWKDSVKEFV